MLEKVRVGISIGDPNGIGLEVIKKSLDALQLSNLEFEVFGPPDLISPFECFANCKLNDTASISGRDISPKLGGEIALASLTAATNALKKGTIDVLVTAPINKDNIQSESFGFPGHTEYLADVLGKQEKQKPLMILCSTDIKVALVTGHVPVSGIASKITEELVLHKIRLLHQSLRVDFGIEKPSIAVLGLNPHAGDNEVIGREDSTVIMPAIATALENGIDCKGPFPADGFFGNQHHKNYDGILAMYHDQGLVPFKLLSFGKGVNFTAGLSAVRTSPDHGTAEDIVGKDIASPSSFVEAVKVGVDIFQNRKKNLEENDQNSF